MNGKELVLNAIQNEATPRAPWVPFVGCHGGKLIGKPADRYLQSGQLLASGLKKAFNLYQPDGLPIIFDLQIEAEALGCALHWAEDTPPAVISHPLDSQNRKTLANLNHFDTNLGRYPEIAMALKMIKKDLGNDIAIYGLICGPFTLALHLRGNEIFLDMFDHPEKVTNLLSFCTEIGRKASDFYIENGADIVAVVDPMTSQISPTHFHQFVSPAVNSIFNHIREKKSLSSLFVCGNVDRNLECMCETSCDNVSVDEQISIPKLKTLAEKHGKSFGGNLKLTVTLLMGDENDCRLDAIRNLDEGGRKGFILSPGCDLPYYVPEKNLQAVAEMVHDEYQREFRRKTLSVKTQNFDHISLPDYQNSDTVIIDVVTLDSTSCAPCQYMVEAVYKALDGLNVNAIIHEHKIKTENGVGMMIKLGVTGIPTICIDGEVKFSSIIPDQPTLKAAIQNAADLKKRTTPRK
ncbi:MAG: uroporphyrinogen decarboxylase family protein [Candidatus Marinimicrobia bacterium]|nr:uroporphyrinogen decarboxylase family protein [Candidatus Neomarinimicrobiota bacterium]